MPERAYISGVFFLFSKDSIYKLGRTIHIIMLSIGLVWARLLSTVADISQTLRKVGLMEVGLMEADFVLQQPRISSVFIYILIAYVAHCKYIDCRKHNFSLRFISHVLSMHF